MNVLNYATLVNTVLFIHSVMANPIMQLLANNTLTGENFPKWKSNLNIVLISENIRYVLTDEMPTEPSRNAPQSVKDKFDRWVVAGNRPIAYILASISDTLRAKVEHKNTGAKIMECL